MTSFCALLFLVMAAGPTAASEVDRLVDAVVQAYGGPSAVTRLEGFRVDADVTSLMQGAAGKVRRDYRAPDKLRVEIAYPKAIEVRILDGDRGWRGDAGRLERVEGAQKLAMVYQMLRSTVPESLVRHRALLELRGTEAREGADYRVVTLRWSGELELSFWVDPGTHRVVWVEGMVKGAGVGTTFATRYGDFREVDGLLFPFAEDNFAGGRSTGATAVRRVAFAPKDLGPFDPTRF